MGYTLNHRPGCFIEDKYDYLRTDGITATKAIEQYNQNVSKFVSDNAILIDQITNEIKARSAIDYFSYPVINRIDSEYGYVYKSYTDKPYNDLYRKNRATNDIQLIIDVNKMAEGLDYCDIGIDIGRDDQIAGVGADFNGDEIYDVSFINLNTMMQTDHVIPSVPYNDFKISPNCKHVFFTRGDAKNWINSVWMYNFDTKKEKKLFEEKDPKFNCGFHISSDRRFLFIVSESSSGGSSEYMFMDLLCDYNENTKLTLFRKREPNHLFYVDSSDQRFFIRTNIGDPEHFRLVTVKYDDISKWLECVNFRSDCFFEDFTCFHNRVVIQSKVMGVNRIDILHTDMGELNRIIVNLDNEPMSFNVCNAPYESDKILIAVRSFRTPKDIVEISSDNSIRVVWSQPVMTYNVHNYISERQMIKSHMGVELPITILRKKDTLLKNSPIYLYGYGGYGISIDPSFDPEIISLLDRGFVYVIAHVRGGSEHGHKWYLDGKKYNKMNSFLDMIVVAEWLTKSGVRSIGLEGRSAGGLLAGGCMVMRPDLFKSVVLGVPFVDVIATMSDATLPLTIGERDEWGDPHRKSDYLYMKQYSPIDNLKRINYPNTLIMSGKNDPRVMYWEHLKFHTKLLDMCTDSSCHLLKTDTGSGHFGSSDKFDHIREIAIQYAFLITTMMIK